MEDWSHGTKGEDPLLSKLEKMASSMAMAFGKILPQSLATPLAASRPYQMMGNLAGWRCEARMHKVFGILTR
uniref:Uncharacterized protein n=1 Tax=Oryza punctata TaxID=4537 RepID=A0A0E0LBF4_ORYPU